jgi:hypothetical protein
LRRRCRAGSGAQAAPAWARGRRALAAARAAALARTAAAAAANRLQRAAVRGPRPLAPRRPAHSLLIGGHSPSPSALLPGVLLRLRGGEARDERPRRRSPQGPAAGDACLCAPRKL